MLDICLLGTGGMMPLPYRWLTSMMARCDGSNLLIDCGEGTQIALKEKGWSPKPVDVICFTHYHADHISGLPGLLLTMGNAERTEPLTMIGPRGLERVVSALRVIAPELPFELKFIELNEPREQLKMGPYVIDAYRVNHNVVCYGYSISIPRTGRFDVERAKAYEIPQKFWSRLQRGETMEEDGKEVTRFTGTIGDIGTSSCYPPHHMTMGEGGAGYTDSPLLNKIIRSFRDWGRDCVCPSGRDNMCGHRFDRQFGELPLGYDHKYVYSHLGYNLKATDMQAAIGCAQLDKFPSFVERRRHNFDRLKAGLEGTEKQLILPEACPHSRPSWFGFLITCREGVERNKVVQYVEKKGVQTRMLFAGNLTKHPCFDEMRAAKSGYRIVGELKNTDRIMADTFWIGVYPGMTDEMTDYMAAAIIEAVKKNS